MQGQIKAEICKKCNGKGAIGPNICDNCRGIGAIGFDGLNEYYLNLDEKGNITVAGVKSQGSLNQNFEYQNDLDAGQLISKRFLHKQTKGVMRGLTFIVIVISYALFILIYFLFINDPKVFFVVSIFTFG